MTAHRALAVALCLALLPVAPARAAESSDFDKLVFFLQLAMAMNKPVPLPLARRFCAHTTELDHPTSDLARKKIMYSCLRELAQKVQIEWRKDLSPFLF